MVKNASNKLKFVPDMYFYEFYQILEDFLEILKICGFSAEKRPFSAFSASRNRTFFFDGKRIRAFKNAQNGLKISILILYIALNRTMEGIFDILSFGRFMRL